MSNLSYKEATDEMLVMVNDAWIPTGHDMYWESVRDERDPAETPWASTVIRHAVGRQVTFGGKGFRMFERVGTIHMNCFAPIGKGLSESYALAKILADAFEGISSPGGVWFRNVRINEIGREGQYMQVNTLADFTYNEVK